MLTHYLDSPDLPTLEMIKWNKKLLQLIKNENYLLLLLYFQPPRVAVDAKDAEAKDADSKAYPDKSGKPKPVIKVLVNKPAQPATSQPGTSQPGTSQPPTRGMYKQYAADFAAKGKQVPILANIITSN